MVDDKTLFLQFQCDSTISISLLMMVIDTDDLIHDIIVFFVLVGLITCIVISRAFQPGNIQKDLDWISWLQFLHNLYFFFGCRSFLSWTTAHNFFKYSFSARSLRISSSFCLMMVSLSLGSTGFMFFFILGGLPLFFFHYSIPVFFIRFNPLK